MSEFGESFQALKDYHVALDMYDRDADKAFARCLEGTLHFPSKTNEEIGEYMKSLYAAHLKMSAVVTL